MEIQVSCNSIHTHSPSPRALTVSSDLPELTDAQLHCFRFVAAGILRSGARARTGPRGAGAYRAIGPGRAQGYALREKGGGGMTDPPSWDSQVGNCRP